MLGAGGFGKVFVGFDMKNGNEKVAIKEIDRELNQKNNPNNPIMREMFIMTNLSSNPCKNILKIKLCHEQEVNGK